MTRTDAKKLEIIGFIANTRTRNMNDDDGDKYLSSADYALEAIEAVVGDHDSPILRQFMECSGHGGVQIRSASWTYCNDGTVESG